MALWERGLQHVTLTPAGLLTYPASWTYVMDSLLALNPRVVVVPGHGPVMHDLRSGRSVRDWLGRINRETSAALTCGDSLGTALKTITLDYVRRTVTGDEKWMDFLFRQFFVRPAVPAAFEQASRR